MIVIPMAGLSQRFFQAGYTRPKYQLDLHGQSVFTRAVRSFEHCFGQREFLFVLRPDHDTEAFVRQELAALGLHDATLHVLHAPTRGQADTVALALRQRLSLADGPITVFNIDSFRHGYRPPDFEAHCDGWLEVFIGEGDHWSFVAPLDGQRVARTAEKQRISALCSNGLYHFRSGRRFVQACDEAIASQQFVRGELYIAPLYNQLLRDGLDIRYRLIDASQIDFCGTPDEYAALLQQAPA